MSFITHSSPREKCLCIYLQNILPLEAVSFLLKVTIMPLFPIQKNEFYDNTGKKCVEVKLSDMIVLTISKILNLFNKEFGTSLEINNRHFESINYIIISYNISFFALNNIILRFHNFNTLYL